MHLILANANVITMDPARPRARSVAIKGPIIEKVLKDNPRSKTGGKTTVIDCRGKTVLPGFIDAHGHLRALAESRVTLDLRPHDKMRSIGDIRSAIRKCAQKTPPGSWIRGRGMDVFHLPERRYLTRRDLDDVSPLHPVKLSERTGYVHTLNSLALKLAGISTATPDPEGGQIDRDVHSGEPTGLLYMMGDYLSQHIPPLEKKALEQGVRLAGEELVSKGITSVHDVSFHNGGDEWRKYSHWIECGYLKTRITMFVGAKNFTAGSPAGFSGNVGGDHLRIGGVKILIDETGENLSPEQAELDRLICEIHRAGWPAACHAVEERAIRSACLAVNRAMKRAPRPDIRHRIEHGSVCPQALARKLAQNRIVVVTQPSFLYFSGERYLKTVPVRKQKYLYPIATLLKQGVVVAAGSDFPVADADPLIGICAAVTRRAQNGEAVSPAEAVGVEEALKMYTHYAALSAGEEELKGTIREGKLADLIVLNADPTEVAPGDIRDIRVDMTIIGGEIVWERS